MTANSVRPAWNSSSGGNHVCISVVIPTTMRESLPRAINSARSQLNAENYVIEIVVVVDRSESSLSAEQRAQLSGADLVLYTGGGKGAPHARNLGVRHSSGDYVAYLDDDDEWERSKLDSQFAVLTSKVGDANIVVSGRVKQQDSRGTLSRTVPDRTIRPDECIEDYLFRNRKPSVGRQSMFTSTLLVNRRLALDVPWDETLKRHQDWDWLVRAGQMGATILQPMDVVSVQTIGSTSSISASNDWVSSLNWIRRWRGNWSGQTYVDFIAGQTLRYALQGRSVRGVMLCIWEILRTRKIPNFNPLMIGAAGLMSRKNMQRMMLNASNRTDLAR